MHPFSAIHRTPKRLGRHASGTPVDCLFSAHREAVGATKLVAEKKQLGEVEVVRKLKNRVLGRSNKDVIPDWLEDSSPLPETEACQRGAAAPSRAIDEHFPRRREPHDRRSQGGCLPFRGVGRAKPSYSNRPRRTCRRPVMDAPVLKSRGMSQVDCHGPSIWAPARRAIKFPRKADRVLARARQPACSTRGLRRKTWVCFSEFLLSSLAAYRERYGKCPAQSTCEI